jgi:hypothetical protein
MKQCPRCRRNLGELDLACPLCGFELLGGGTERPGSPTDETETAGLGGPEARGLDDTDITLSGDAETTVRGDLASLLREHAHPVHEEPHATPLDFGAPSEPEAERGADALSDLPTSPPVEPVYGEPPPDPAHGFSDAGFSLDDAAPSLSPEPSDSPYEDGERDGVDAADWHAADPRPHVPSDHAATHAGDGYPDDEPDHQPATEPLSALDDDVQAEPPATAAYSRTSLDPDFDAPTGHAVDAAFSPSERFEALDDLEAATPLDTDDRFVAPVSADGIAPAFETSDPGVDAEDAVDVLDAGAEVSGTLVPAGATPPPTPAPATNRRLPVLLSAVAGLGALAFIGMPMLREAPQPAPSSATAAAAPVAAPAAAVGGGAATAIPTPAPADAPVKWSAADGERWTGGRSRAVAFELQAENHVPVWMDRVRPVLVVRCMARKTEVFVVTESAARIEPQDDKHTVTVSFDGGPKESARWPDSAEHDALFAPDGEAMAKRLAAANSLQFGFTPHNAAPATVAFDVHGFDKMVGEVSKACRWR